MSHRKNRTENSGSLQPIEPLPSAPELGYSSRKITTELNYLDFARALEVEGKILVIQSAS
jgi:hypothetical protein